jgi:eukaryotic-like serine/threonine-protein kinase
MDSLLGKTIDSYQILEVIGRGGMGVVFKAIDTNLEKYVALKMIDPFLARDEGFVKRFKTEAKALAKLENPNIVSVYALRQTEAGLFMVMEYVDAKPLSNCIREDGPFSVKDTISIAKQLLNAIGHAHKVGVIHRDIKPSNILLCPDGRIKVTDFGLAKVVKQKGPSSTVTQTRAGTLYYMSPEQVKGLKNVDKRSDIYSLGMTVYEIMVGRVPFDKTDSDFTIQKKIVDGEIPSPVKFDATIPKKLTKIIQKSIDKDPDKRYQEADEMIEALNNFESDISHVQKSIKKPHGEKPVYKQPVFFLSALAVLLGGALIYSLVFSRPGVEQDKAFLSILTDPPDAQILIDDTEIGNSPLERFRIEKAGDIRLKVMKPGYAAVDTLLNIELGAAKTIEFALASAGSEKFSVTTSPSAANIYINNELIGSSPVNNFFLNPGQTNLRIQKIGYRLVDTTINIEKGKPNSFNFTLNSDIAGGQSGGLKITSNPSGANVWLNQEFVGTTPYEISELAVGSYRVLMRKKGFADYNQSVTITSNKTSTISRNLSPVGKLVVSSEPSGAEVLINGKTVGKTSHTIEQLEAGEHKLTIRKEGFKPFTLTIKIEADKTTTISEKLNPLMGKIEILVRPYGSIFINDQLKISDTNAPYVTELPGGSHNIRIVHPSLGTYTKKIDIVDESVKKYNIDFNRAIKLTVVSDPINCEIFLDGKTTGKTTPGLLRLGPGKHTIQVKRDGYQPSEEKVYSVEYSIYEGTADAEDRLNFSIQKIQ